MPDLSAAIKTIIKNRTTSAITLLRSGQQSDPRAQANSGSDWPSFKRYGILRLKSRSDKAAELAEKTRRVAIYAVEAAPPQHQRMWFRISYPICRRDGEIGRRSGLKIRRGQKVLWGFGSPPGTSHREICFHTPITVPNNL
jgi:hypothetical protein